MSLLSLFYLGRQGARHANGCAVDCLWAITFCGLVGTVAAIIGKIAGVV